MRCSRSRNLKPVRGRKGPSTTRENINSAPLPGLTDPLSNLLQGFLQSGQLPQGFSQPSALQQQSSNAFSNLLNQGNPGTGVIDAAQPVYQRNLQQSADMLRQAGPRFNSNTERLVGEQGNKAMQDFNLFQQQVLQQGQTQQLNNLTGAGNFANNQQQQQMDLIQKLLGISGDLGAGPAVLQQHPGTFDQIMKGLGTASQFIPGAGGKGGGASAPNYSTAQQSAYNAGNTASGYFNTAPAPGAATQNAANPNASIDWRTLGIYR